MTEIIKAKVTNIIVSSSVISLKERETPRTNFTSLAIVHAETDSGMQIEFIVPIPFHGKGGGAEQIVKHATYYFKCFKQLMKMPDFAQGYDFVGYLCIDIDSEK